MTIFSVFVNVVTFKNKYSVLVEMLHSLQSCSFKATLLFLKIKRRSKSTHLCTFDPDVIWTRNLLIWSQTRYRCATRPVPLLFPGLFPPSERTEILPRDTARDSKNSAHCLGNHGSFCCPKRSPRIASSLPGILSQRQYRSQWSLTETWLLLVENFNPIPVRMTWNIVSHDNFW